MNDDALRTHRLAVFLLCHSQYVVVSLKSQSGCCSTEHEPVPVSSSHSTYLSFLVGELTIFFLLLYLIVHTFTL